MNSGAAHTHPQISVIICTHNPRSDLLQRTLSALTVQTLPRDEWELILVDNASREVLAEKWDLSWHPAGRHCREEELGTSAARLRGTKEANGDLLVFVDDDNLLAPDYLELAKSLSKLPHLGAFGAARILPTYEVQPRPDLEPYCRLLALRNEPEDRWTNSRTIKPDTIPFGAGLCFKRSVAEELIRRKSKGGPTFGAKGDKLFRAEDLEYPLAAADIGLGYGIFTCLTVTHLIPASRVEVGYLLRLAEGMAFSNALLGRLRNHELSIPAPSRFPKLRLLAGMPFKALSARNLTEIRFEFRSRRGVWQAVREFRRILASS